MPDKTLPKPPRAGRYRINQPSTLQPFREFHGQRGIAVFGDDGPDHARFYFSEGDTISARVAINALSHGWPAKR